MALSQDILKIRFLRQTKQKGKKQPEDVPFDPLQFKQESPFEMDPYSDSLRKNEDVPGIQISEDILESEGFPGKAADSLLSKKPNKIRKKSRT